MPVKLDTATNGECLPRPLPRHLHEVNRTSLEQATAHAQRLGWSRRKFLVSLSGAATCLLAMNRVNAAIGKTGGLFVLPAESDLDLAAATEALGKREFIFDIQTHHFDPHTTWSAATPWSEAIRSGPNTVACNRLPEEEFGYMTCTDARSFVREIFMDSDTDAAVLSFVPTAEDKMPLSYEEASATRQLVAARDGGKRLLLHGRIIPSLPGDLARMEEVLEEWDIAAWKTYTQYGPDGSSGWWLDDDHHGAALMERARATGVTTICCHKGLPLPFPLMGENNLQYKSCRDVGPAAAANPDIRLIIYHSGFDPDLPEGAFEPGNPKTGIDSLCQSLIDAGVPPNANVYAELGSTWHDIMRDPDQAAHSLGKLLRYVGERNVVWGTDCIFYGSPQDQIQAFRSFQISDRFQAEHGYPALTDAMKARIFGLNALDAYGLDETDFAGTTRDAIARARQRYAEQPDPSFVTYGPRTRREMLALARLEQP